MFAKMTSMDFKGLCRSLAFLVCFEDRQKQVYFKTVSSKAIYTDLCPRPSLHEERHLKGSRGLWLEYTDKSKERGES